MTLAVGPLAVRRCVGLGRVLHGRLVERLRAQQSIDQADQLTSGQDQGPLMRVPRGLGVLDGIVVGVLGAVSSYTVGRLDQVVAQIAVAALAERGLFSLELAGFVGRPGQAGKLSDGVIVGEPADLA